MNWKELNTNVVAGWVGGVLATATTALVAFIYSYASQAPSFWDFFSKPIALPLWVLLIGLCLIIWKVLPLAWLIVRWGIRRYEKWSTDRFLRMMAAHQSANKNKATSTGAFLPVVQGSGAVDHSVPFLSSAEIKVLEFLDNTLPGSLVERDKLAKDLEMPMGLLQQAIKSLELMGYIEHELAQKPNGAYTLHFKLTNKGSEAIFSH